MQEKEWVKWLRTLGEIAVLALLAWGAMEGLKWMTASADGMRVFYAVKNGGVIR